jgi:acetyl esterase/lipase
MSLLGLMSLFGRYVDGAEPAYKDIVYRTIGDADLKLDIYHPQKPETKWPAIVWVHGGAWRSGSKSDVPISRMLEYGFAIVSVDYRLSTVAKFPAQAQDIHAAIRYVKYHGEKYSVDRDRIIIAGASAGGHLSALVGLTAENEELAGGAQAGSIDTSEVRGIVSFFGASNLETILTQSTPFGLTVRIPALELLLGGQPEELPELAKLASPTSHVGKRSPALWLYHGDQDPQMPIEQSYELDSKYREFGLTSRLRVIAGGKHGGRDFFSDELLGHLASELKRTLTEK